MGKRTEQAELLPGMAPAFQLSMTTVGQEVVVGWGRRALFVFDASDRGMRNLAIVALTRAGASGIEVAKLFGLSPEYVSRLRTRAVEGGSAALVPPMGRPRTLSSDEVALAYDLADKGHPGVEIAAQLGVSTATISRLLARRVRREPQELALGTQGQPSPDEIDEKDENSEGADGEDEQSRDSELTRIQEGERNCAYAGAMLLHGFLERTGVGPVLATLPSRRARIYDATALVLSATFGFVLGASSAEGTKHLLGADAGALVGLESFPHLRTLRPRLCALADAVDPLEVQVALATEMLDADDQAPEVFFVDDHFVSYTGSAPVAKGWNTRTRRPEPGRDDTFVIDESWRAICFASGAPSGLSKTMWGPLEQLSAITKGTKVTIGFDRGGSYPKVFRELNQANFDWITYRRCPLLTPTLEPKVIQVDFAGRSYYIQLADEIVKLNEVGEIRQISIYEKDKVCLQILTSDLLTPPEKLVPTLRARWRIENTFKYLEDHHGIHWLCDYNMAIRPDTAKVTNPARTKGRADLQAAELAVCELERRIGALVSNPADNEKETSQAISELTSQLEVASTLRETTRAALKCIPAKLSGTEIDPGATRATPRTNRRAMQMVCRLLAYNAELDLARALNTYLEDPDEYRAITRNLLHQPGRINYASGTITVTIRQPDAPRINRALGLLIEKLNTEPPRLTGDSRRIIYQIETKT